jgi:hypothetical protein
MDNPKPPQPPELETEPAGEANTTVSTTLPINDVVEPPQTETAQPPTEPVPTPETPQTEQLSEPLQTAPETPTPHLPVDEALPETTPEPTPQGADLNHEDAVGQEAQAEAPKMEAPTTTAESENLDSGSEAGMTMHPAQTQQGTAQPEPVQEQEPPASPPESLPAQATPIPTPPQNILMLLLTKAHLVTQLRKQKKLIKVMGMFATKKSITNDDVEKLLHVSDATALRYLTQLKKENKIIQIGKTGQGVTYTKR